MRRLRDLFAGRALVAWFAARVVVFGALSLSTFLVDDLGARSPTGRPSTGLTGWDAGFYLRISEDGYDSVAPDGLRFFPLLPLLSRVVALALGGNHRLALLVVANLAALGAGLLVERLARRESGDDGLAARAAWFLALAPPAFVLVMGYAEPLMMAAAAGGLLALRERRWGWAAAAGFLAGLSRPLGVLFVVAALLEVAPGLRAASQRARGGRLAAVLGAPAGLASFLAWSHVAHGDALLPLRLQGGDSLRGNLVNPVSRLAEAGRDLASGDLVGSGLHLVWALGFLGLLVVLFRRWPLSFAVFSGVVLIAALSADNLDSLERYALSSVGFVLAAATVASRPIVESLVLVFAGAGMAAYATLAFLGAYVP
jgi:hypothetical protein